MNPKTYTTHPWPQSQWGEGRGQRKNQFKKIPHTTIPPPHTHTLRNWILAKFGPHSPHKGNITSTTLNIEWHNADKHSCCGNFWYIMIFKLFFTNLLISMFYLLLDTSFNMCCYRLEAMFLDWRIKWQIFFSVKEHRMTISVNRLSRCVKVFWQQFISYHLLMYLITCQMAQEQFIPIQLRDFKPLADFGGGGRARDARPSPGRPNSFDFMQFSGKFGKIVCWHPSPWGVGAPSSEKSGSATASVKIFYLYFYPTLHKYWSQLILFTSSWECNINCSFVCIYDLQE